MYSRWKSNWIQVRKLNFFIRWRQERIRQTNSHLLCQVTRNQEPNIVITALKITSARAINKIEWGPMIELPLMLFPDTVLLGRQSKNYDDNRKESVLTPPSFQVGAHLDSGCLEGLPAAWLSPAQPHSCPLRTLPWAILQGRVVSPIHESLTSCYVGNQDSLLNGELSMPYGSLGPIIWLLFRIFDC